MRATSWLLALVLAVLAAPAGAAGRDRLYRALGLQRGAKPEEIKAAHRKMCLRYHPDKNRDNPKPAEAKFKEAQEAYEVLKDPQRRQLYDAYGEEGLQATDGPSGSGGGAPFGAGAAGFDPHGMYFGSGEASEVFRQMFAGRGAAGLFSQLFGMEMPRAGFGARGGRGPTSGDHMFDLELSLDDLYQGGPRTVAVDLTVRHPASGAYYRVRESYTIDVVAGWKEGTRISFGARKVRYDELGVVQLPPVTFIVSQRKHRYFERVGDDLLVKIRMSSQQARSKLNLEVQLLDGTKFSFVTGARGERIEHGTVRSFHGRGMPIKGGPKRGKLLVQFVFTDRRDPFGSTNPFGSANPFAAFSGAPGFAPGPGMGGPGGMFF